MHWWLLWLRLLTYGKMISSAFIRRQLQRQNCEIGPETEAEFSCVIWMGPNFFCVWKWMRVYWFRMTADWAVFWSSLLADHHFALAHTNLQCFAVKYCTAHVLYTELLLCSARKQVSGCRKEPRVSFASHVTLWTCCSPSASEFNSRSLLLMLIRIWWWQKHTTHICGNGIIDVGMH